MMVNEILAKIQELTPLSPSIGRLATLVNDPESDIQDIVEVIQFDEAATMGVLKFANSAMSASRVEITSIKNAVIRLGGQRILKYLLGKGVKGQMNVTMDVYGYSEKDLWNHSVAAAIVADEIGSIRKETSDEKLGFTTALLHDVGKLVLCRALDENVIKEIWKQIDYSPDLSDEQAERNVLGISHADVGYEILKAWGLPEKMALAVKNHHSIEEGKDTLTDVVRIANVTARMIGAGVGREGMNVIVDEVCLDRLGITSNQVELLCAEGAMKLQEVLLMYE
ncbi:MAG: HDOD domain-containing protein [Fibrobacterales bacterium]